MKSCAAASFARRIRSAQQTKRSVYQMMLKGATRGAKISHRCLASLPSQQTPTDIPGPILHPFAVDASDGTCEELDAVEAQRVVDDFVQVEADHSFLRHLEEDHVDFYGLSDGPLNALHPPVLSRNKRSDKVQHLLAVTPEDLARSEREQYMKVAVCLEDLQGFGPDTMKSVLDDPCHYAAVDGPDGTPDDIVRHDMEEVEHWIEDAAIREDKNFVDQLHAQQADAARFYAIDSPDGTPDAAIKDEMHYIEEIIEYAAEHEDKEEVLRMHKENEEIKETISKGFPI